MEGRRGPAVEHRQASPRAVMFHYRQSPAALEPLNVSGEVRRDDPPMTAPGMAEVFLDGRGCLLELTVVPPRHHDETASPGEPRWEAAFEPPGSRCPRSSRRSPRAGRPWTRTRSGRGTASGISGAGPRCASAASLWGRLVWFQVLPPSGGPVRDPSVRKAPGLHRSRSPSSRPTFSSSSARQAWRDATSAPAAWTAPGPSAWRSASWASRCWRACSASTTWRIQERRSGCSRRSWRALFWAGHTWLFYAALEPPVRRRWPLRLVGWTRLLGRRLRDPLVGREVLVGTLAGAAIAGIILLTAAAPSSLNPSGFGPHVSSLSSLAEVRRFPFVVLWSAYQAILKSICLLCLLLLIRGLVPSEAATVALGTLALSLTLLPGGDMAGLGFHASLAENPW